jgi:hypothetical protein
MKKQLNFVLMLALSAGTLSVVAVAQDSHARVDGSARVEYATFNPAQSGLLRQVDSDDHRRCDGDRDRNDRNCYDRDHDAYRDQYQGYAYYGNGYYAAPNYYAAPARNGWYDHDGRWHAYDRDRDRDRRRYDDDDRR